MYRRLFLLICLFSLKSPLVIHAIPPDELPFGAMYLSDYDTSEVRKLAEDMCFNFLVEYTDILDVAKIESLYDHGIQAIRGGIIDSNGNWQNSEYPMKYSWSHYAEIEIDTPFVNEEVIFASLGGHYTQDGSMWVSDSGSVDTLSGLSTHLDRHPSGKYRDNSIRFFDSYFHGIFPGALIYRIDIIMKLSTIGETADVATVEYGLSSYDACDAEFLEIGTITTDSLTHGNDAIDTVSFEIQLPAYPDTITYYKESGGVCDSVVQFLPQVYKRYDICLTLDIITTGNRKVYIDKMLISDVAGRELMAGDHDNDITNVLDDYSGIGSKIYGWMLMDEPLFSNYTPFGHIDALMRSEYADWITFTDFWDYLWSPHSYLNKVQKDYINADIYPYGYGDKYADDLFQYFSGDSTGPLYRFDKHLSWVKERIVQYSDTTGFWQTVQAFSDGPAGQNWRFPTGPELSVNVFMAMTYACQGFQFWYYDNPNFYKGILDSNRDPTDLYDQIRDHIGPYIQAIDEYYVTLLPNSCSSCWDTSFVYDGEDHYSLPSNAWISSISTYHDPDTLDPDAGWYQIGQFDDPSSGSVKYLMLVNRACSRGVNDSLPAPSVTATVRFDPTNLGLGNYIYIIDLADSLRLAGADTGWVGIPDTTYSAKMPDGTIPCTTVLGPGEGRLFKIVQASEVELGGGINTNYTYQGRIQMTADALVPSSKTMTILGPARIEILRCPIDSTGQDTALVEFNVNGALNAIGTSSDSVIFYPDTAVNCTPILSDDPEPGDWYGIYFNQNSEGTFEYCSINYARFGLDMENNADIVVTHSNISNNETTGIDNYKGYLDLINSLVSDNGIYGVDSEDGADSVYNTKFTDNGSYGIKIVGTTGSNDESYLIGDTITCACSSTQYGVRIDGNNYVTIDSCWVSRYKQGEIRLSNSDASIKNTDFTSGISDSTVYGLYTANGSDPIVHYCKFSFLKTAVEAHESHPFLGDTSSTDNYGNSEFTSCSKYFVYFHNSNQLSDSMWAQKNWWGSTRPDSGKFYTPSAGQKIIWSPALLGPPKLMTEPIVPLEFTLSQNYPNPFNPNTTVRFILDEPGYTVVTIYNLLGQRVATLSDGFLNSGEYNVVWDGRNSSGMPVASGVYFYAIQSGDHFDSKKMLLLR